MPGTPEYDVTEQGGQQVRKGDDCILAEHFHQPCHIVVKFYAVAVLMHDQPLKLEDFLIMDIDFGRGRNVKSLAVDTPYNT